MKNDNVFDGFQFLASTLGGQGDSNTGGGDFPIVDPSDITGDANDDPAEDEDVIKDGIITGEGGLIDPKDITGEADDDDDTPPAGGNDASDVTELGDMEGDITEYVQEKLFAELGLTIEDEHKAKDVKGLVELMREIVEENSTPTFASDDVAKLNDFVLNGGDITKFIEATSGVTELSKLDMSKEDNQKLVVKELLKNKGYSDTRIDKAIERYEDAGTLEEEAIDAKDILAEYREKDKERLLEETKKTSLQAKEQQRQYITDVESTINNMEAIRGVPVTKAEKAKLMDYIFRPTSEGITQYQKDYIKSHANLVESAYFTMKGDSLVQKVKTQANSEAARRLKEKLADKGKRAKDQTNQGGGSTLWNLASGVLRK